MDNNDHIEAFEPIPKPDPVVVKRTESRLAAWWSAWKWVAIVTVLLGLSLWGNLHQYGTIRSAKADCKTLMVAAAKQAIEDEQKRAAAADKQAGKIAADTKHDTQSAARSAQERTNETGQRIAATRTTGACRMPDGLPRLTKAVDAANAAAGD